MLQPDQVRLKWERRRKLRSLPIFFLSCLFVCSSAIFAAAPTNCNPQVGCGSLDGCVFDNETSQWPTSATACAPGYSKNNFAGLEVWLARYHGFASWSCCKDSCDDCEAEGCHVECQIQKDNPTGSCAAINNNKACARHNDNGDNPQFVYHQSAVDAAAYECMCKKACGEISRADHGQFFWTNAHNHLTIPGECQRYNDKNIPMENYVEISTALSPPPVYDGYLFGNYSRMQACLNCFTSSDPWFQVINGNLFAQKDLQGPHISQKQFPYLLNSTTCTTSNQSGTAVLGQTDSHFVIGNGSQIVSNRRAPNSIAIGSLPAIANYREENFTYFQEQLNYDQIQSQPCTSYNYIGTSPNNDNVLDSQVCVIDHHDKDETITLNSSIHIRTGQKKAIFIYGNLQVDAPIKVDPGGFLAFIVAGDITFSSDLGNDITDTNLASTCPSTAQSHIDGVFIADGQINFPAKAIALDAPIQKVCNRQLTLSGNYIGWQGLNFAGSFAGCITSDFINQRTYPDYNSVYPVYSFIQRADFIINAPLWMRYQLRLRTEQS